MATDRARLSGATVRQRERSRTPFCDNNTDQPRARFARLVPGCSILAPVSARIWYSRVRHLGSLI
jgi:hypothetical protein